MAKAKYNKDENLINTDIYGKWQGKIDPNDWTKNKDTWISQINQEVPMPERKQLILDIENEVANISKKATEPKEEPTEETKEEVSNNILKEEVNPYKLETTDISDMGNDLYDKYMESTKSSPIDILGGFKGFGVSPKSAAISKRYGKGEVEPAFGIGSFLRGLSEGYTGSKQKGIDKQAVELYKAQQKGQLDNEKLAKLENSMKNAFYSRTKDSTEGISNLQNIQQLIASAEVLETEKRKTTDPARLKQIDAELGQKDTAMTSTYVRLFEKGVLTDQDIARHANIGNILAKGRQWLAGNITGVKYNPSERNAFKNTTNALAGSKFDLYNQEVESLKKTIDSYNQIGLPINFDRVVTGSSEYVKNLQKSKEYNLDGVDYTKEELLNMFKEVNPNASDDKLLKTIENYKKK
jgi:hypothetical protein